MEKVACKLVLLVSSPSSAFVRATSQIKANLTEHRMNPGTAEMLGTVVQSVNRKKRNKCSDAQRSSIPQ